MRQQQARAGTALRTRRANRPVVESLEGRALLSTTPSVWSRSGSVDRRGGSDTVLMQLLPGQFTAPASGTILFDVEVKAADGSSFVPGAFQILGPTGRPVTASFPFRSDGSTLRRVSLAPGEYSVRVFGRGGSTGAFEVVTHMVGDVDGDRKVTQADIAAIGQAQGVRRWSPLYAAPLDINHDGVIGRADLNRARANLGANAGRTFTFTLANNTNNAFNADNIYVAIIGNVGGRNVHVTSTGDQVPMRESDNNAPGSVTRNGLVYTPSYSMKLSEFLAKGIPIGQINSGRVWIGLGAPIYFHVFAGGGFTQPNVANPSDPNADTNFDFVEFTLDGGGLHANTSQVDAFAIPLTMNVVGAKNQTVGITEPRSALFAAFANSVPAEFKGLVDPKGFRITSPKKSPTFPQNYFQPYIDAMWSYYQTRDLSISTIFGTYVGRVNGNTFVFRNPANGSTYNVAKPSSADVIGSTGSIVTGDETEKAIKARISAMINRHVATDATQSDPTQYYLAAPANFYSKFWHDHSLNRLAYGFDYDDVFDQSTSVIDTNPSRMTVSVTWG